MCRGKFFLDGEVILIKLNQAAKLFLAHSYKCPQSARLKSIIGGSIESENPEFALHDSKNERTSTDDIFSPYLRLVLGRWSLL